LIGREEELEMLLRRWQQAKTGEGRVVLLSAEAGIGKSRLAEALVVRLIENQGRSARSYGIDCSSAVQRSSTDLLCHQIRR
jgi:predicted ATPase